MGDALQLIGHCLIPLGPLILCNVWLESCGFKIHYVYIICLLKDWEIKILVFIAPLLYDSVSVRTLVRQ